MTKRILAVSAAALMLIPLFLIGVSADSLGDICIKDYIPFYESKLDFMKATYGGYVNDNSEYDRSFRFLMSQYGGSNTSIQNTNVLFYTDGDNEDFIAVGDSVTVSRRFIRDMTEGYSLNVLLSANAYWEIRTRNNLSVLSGSQSVHGSGAIYITYKFDGTTDICFFDTNKNSACDRVRIVFDGTSLVNTVDDKGNIEDHLVFQYIEKRLRVNGNILKSKDIQLLDLAVYSMDDTQISFPYLLETLLKPDSVDRDDIIHWEYVEQRWRDYQELRQLASDAAGNAYDMGETSGYDTGYDKGMEEGYSKYYYQGKDDGFAEGKEAGYMDGKEDGLNEGWADGYEQGIDQGYGDGYDFGYRDGAQYETNMGSLVFTILESPIRLIDGMLNFDLFGINVAGLVKTLLTLSITAAIVFFIFKMVRG